MIANVLTVAATFVALAAGHGRPDGQGTPSDSPLPVSLARIRAALAQPPPVLSVTQRSDEMPTFRVEVRQTPFLLRPIEEEAFDPTWGLPSAGELLMGAIERVRSAAGDYRRKRAKRRARREVDEALLAFCAARECQEPDKR